MGKGDMDGVFLCEYFFEVVVIFGWFVDVFYVVFVECVSVILWVIF